jgi:hypothetical protein
MILPVAPWQRTRSGCGCDSWPKSIVC